LSYDSGLLNIPLYVLWNLENYKSQIEDLINVPNPETISTIT